MLRLTRKVNQGVRMYDETGRFIGRLFIVGVERGRVELGFEVDARFVLLRDEVVQASEKATP